MGDLTLHTHIADKNAEDKHTFFYQVCIILLDKTSYNFLYLHRNYFVYGKTALPLFWDKTAILIFMYKTVLKSLFLDQTAVPTFLDNTVLLSFFWIRPHLIIFWDKTALTVLVSSNFVDKTIQFLVFWIIPYLFHFCG